MAKRRKLEAPSAAALDQIEAEYQQERDGARRSVAPIAQVAGEAASEAEVLGVETRAKLAEADLYLEAQAKGLVMRDIPIDEIRIDDLVRDRAVIDRDELTELRASIVKNGLRLPIEVYRLPEAADGRVYGLISGYRRMLAFQEALSATGLDQFKSIKAIVRDRADSAGAIAAMVEENEIRADLSPFERGRIAALSAQSGVFVNVEDAVAQLFPFSSKAKRSKIRSFARIFEELGDLLQFPEALSERQGLAVATALRAGADLDLRDLLATRTVETSEQEWRLIEPVLQAFKDTRKDPARGGRPKTDAKNTAAEVVDTPRGVKIRWEALKTGGFSLRLTGDVDPDEMRDLVRLMQERLR